MCIDLPFEYSRSILLSISLHNISIELILTHFLSLNLMCAGRTFFCVQLKFIDWLFGVVDRIGNISAIKRQISFSKSCNVLVNIYKIY